MSPRTFTVAERPDLEDRLDEISDPWPEFMKHDPVVRRLSPALYERFRDFQFVLYDQETDIILGEGCSIPIRWDRATESLAAGVRVLESGFTEPEPNVLCALMAVVDPRHQGRKLSGLIVAAMGRPPEAPASNACSLPSARPGRSAIP